MTPDDLLSGIQIPFKTKEAVMAEGELTLKTPNMRALIDFGGKALAGLAGFMAADAWIVKDVQVTPDFIAPLAGWIICLGVAVVLVRAVKP